MNNSETLTKTTKNHSEILHIFELQKKRAIELRQLPLSYRSKQLRRLEKWLLQHRDLFREAITSDFSRPEEEVDLNELFVVISEIRHTLKHLYRWAAPERVQSTLPFWGSKAEVRYEPKGVCLVIAPWNYPVNLALAPVISAIAAGNTVIMKPSEMTPLTSVLLSKLVSELFQPEDVAVVQGGVDESQYLLSLPFDHIFFTGSPGIGKVVMAAAAKNLSSVTLELGGKSPVIIDETADIKDTAQKIAWGKFINAGQTCIAPDYIFVHKKIATQFIDTLKIQIETLFSDNQSFVNKSCYAEIVNKKHYDRLSDLLDEAVNEGAEVKMGGQYLPDKNKITPTLLSQVPKTSRIMTEEIFGPLLPILLYDDVQEPITFINSNPKPLALYVFSKKTSKANYILTQTSSGTACINETVVQFLHPNLPFGGVNNSGIGKSHGKYGFIAFSNEKAVLHQRRGLTMTKLFYPPYTPFKKFLIDFALKYL